MVDPSLPLLSEWGNFYVITGSAAAALSSARRIPVAVLRVYADAGRVPMEEIAQPTD